VEKGTEQLKKENYMHYLKLQKNTSMLSLKIKTLQKVVMGSEAKNLEFVKMKELKRKMVEKKIIYFFPNY